MCKDCAIIFSIRNLSILGHEHPWGILETVPVDSKGQTYICQKPVEYTSPRVNPWWFKLWTLSDNDVSV